MVDESLEEPSILEQNKLWLKLQLVKLRSVCARVG